MQTMPSKVCLCLDARSLVMKLDSEILLCTIRVSVLFAISLSVTNGFK
jgi:hypothetical protein